MKHKAIIQNLLLVLVSLIFAALMAEILLRIMLPSPIVWKYPQEKYLFDPETGHRLKPNQQAYTHDKTVSINSRGIRDHEYSREYVRGVYRIVALGDSQTFGNGLEILDTWPKQLERELSQSAEGLDFEVLNGGLPASDTWQHEILLGRLTEHYKPDAVILAFYVNDIVRKPDNISLSESYKRSENMYRLIYLVKSSALMLALRETYYALNQYFSPNKWFLKQDSILRGETDMDIEARWRQVEQSISAMKEITDRENIDFMVVSIPRRDQVSGQFPAEKYNQRLAVLAERAEINLFNSLELLQHAYKEHGQSLFIPWDGHNSSIANQVIARGIAAEASAIGIIKK